MDNTGITDIIMFRSPSGDLELLVPRSFARGLAGPGGQARVRYGSEPEGSEIADIRKDLRTRVETGVGEVVDEMLFIPRFLLAALVFVAVYFFLALVVRDPIPLVDETVGALASAVLFWILRARYDRRSDRAARLMADAARRVDAIRFMPEPGLAGLETFLMDVSRSPDTALALLREGLMGQVESLDPETRAGMQAWAKDARRKELPAGMDSLLGPGKKGDLGMWLYWCRSRSVSPWKALLGSLWRT